jgi:hypothetical protein
MLEGLDAYVGSLEAAARAFGASELYIDGGRPVIISRSSGLDGGIPDGTIVARVFTSAELRDGRTVWILPGDYAAGIACSPEAS